MSKNQILYNALNTQLGLKTIELNIDLSTNN